MKGVVFLIVPLLLVNQAASAASATGNSALALASLVSEQSPLLKISTRRA